MHSRVVRGLIYLGILVSAVPEFWAQQSPDDCQDYDRVIYGTAGELRMDRGDGTATAVLLRTLPSNTLLSADLQTLEKQRSPQGTVFFVQTPGTVRPVNTSLFIFGNKARPLALRIDITNHMYEVHARWINEKLLSLQVWLGRIASWDLILDVETLKFVYAEGANYGTSILSCREKMQLQENRK